MDKQKSQSGFAHLMIITVILAVGLIGTLGYVFYQNFVVKKDSNSKVSVDGVAKKDSNIKDNSTSVKDIVEYKTYKFDINNLSFKYPSTWAVGQVVIPYEGTPNYNRSVDVKNSSGEVVARLTSGVSGLGGTCGDLPVSSYPTFTVLDAESSSIVASKPVSFSFIVSPPNNGGTSYTATYGLSDTYTKTGELGHICMIYDLFDSNIKTDDGYGTYAISFGNGPVSGKKPFASLEDAKQYVKSDEYKEIKKMLLSLNY